MMLTLFLLYCMVGAIGLMVYGSDNRSESALRDWIYSVLLMLAWPLICFALLYKIFFSRDIK